MKIAIIGAGIIGVTTAYELASDGHEVHVFEKRSSACEESSFANAGVVAPGYVTPWAAPGMLGKVLKYLFQKHAPVRLKMPLKAAELSWIYHWLQQCKPELYASNRADMQRLASYSADRLKTLTQTLDLTYEQATGYMVLLRSEQELAQVQPSLKVLADAGFEHKVLDAAAARKIEPALSPDAALHAAVHLPNDMVANCRQFALLLRAKAEELGAKFHFNCAAHSLIQKGLQGIQVGGELSESLFDKVVVTAGADSAALLKPLGLHVPIMPVYGYSVSAPIREPMDAPMSGVMDERYKVSITRLGNRIRVAGSAEIGGTAGKMNEAAIQTLYKVLDDWFPAAADTKRQVQTWKGARPMLPEGRPIIGESKIPNIWLNLGHGSSGWALSCGSARLLADKISGKKPTIEL